jgi:hypothetical protein
LNKTGDPDFLHAAPDMTTCAAFSKESRMRCANATKLHRKSGGSPSFFFPVTRCRTLLKALEKDRIQPMYAKVRDRRAPSRGKAWWQTGKAVDKMTANTKQS